MKYRKMPGSPERLSALGLGLMRLPTAKDGKIDEPRVLEMLQYAVDNGVNYFDTAWVYHRGESEQVLGKFVAQNDRSKFYIATKLPCWMVKQESDAADYLEKQLEKLQTDYVDYYLLHSLHDKAWKEMRRLKVPAWLEKARSDGKIRHIGFSFHDKYPVFKKIVNGFDWEFCQFMFNYLDTHYQAGLNGYRLAVEKGLGVIAMEPLRGGKLVQSIPLDIESVWKKSSHAWTPVQRALNWVWDHPGCTVALSGMSSLEQLQENVRLANSAKAGLLDEKELKIYNRARLEYLRRIPVPCSECGYCLPCPNKVAIPEVFGHYNEAVMFNQKRRHKQEYLAWIPEDSRADKCVNCGACVPKCTQQINIPERMKDVAKYFSEDKE